MATLNTTYEVTVQASDGGVGTTATEAVTIEVTNVDEPGTVTLSTLQPQVQRPITATLDDPDTQDPVSHHHLAVVPGQQPHHGRDQGRKLDQ